ncbi:hypothetical protein Tco_0573156 [Tanacetum coccineum]
MDSPSSRSKLPKFPEQIDLYVLLERLLLFYTFDDDIKPSPHCQKPPDQLRVQTSHTNPSDKIHNTDPTGRAFVNMLANWKVVRVLHDDLLWLTEICSFVSLRHPTYSLSPRNLYPPECFYRVSMQPARSAVENAVSSNQNPLDTRVPDVNWLLELALIHTKLSSEGRLFLDDLDQRTIWQDDYKAKVVMEEQDG